MGLYRTLWRWHFYAGLFCIPFILLLSLTGSIYLFKPQFEGWQDSGYNHLAAGGTRLWPSAEVAAALQAVPGAQLDSYELPPTPDAAARIWVRDEAGHKVRVVVDPLTGQVLETVDGKDRFMAIVHDLHGELLLGDRGSLLIELAASWAFVMVLTGLYLWWPRNAAGLAGVLYPRLNQGKRVWWRDLHAVTGIWVSAFALFLLFTALPWTGVWGDAFKAVRQATGPAVVKQDWSSSRAADAKAAAAEGHEGHEGHDHAAMQAAADQNGDQTGDRVTLDTIVAQVRPLGWAAPVFITPPGGKSVPWAASGTAKGPQWRARSDSQDRTLRQSMSFDATSGAITQRETFKDKHLIDRIVGVGVAAHEGQLFGWFNQLLGVLTALGLATLAVSGTVMWWRRRPEGRLGAPPTPEAAQFGKGLVIIIVAMAVFLPVLGASLVLVGLLEWLVLRRIAPVRDWLGLAAATSRQ